MSHYHRAYLRGGVYFFTVVTWHRVPVFVDDARVAVLREAFRKVQMARPFKMDVMVILPDHLHCIWRLPEGDADYSGRWREIKKAVSRQIDPTSHARQERWVWQRRFWEHLIRDELDWRRHVDYIHYNPVKHGKTTRPDDWQWSSFRHAVAKGWYDPSWGEREPATIQGMDYE